MRTIECLVLLGGPAQALDPYAAQLAKQSDALYFGDMSLAFADTVEELLQVFELSQIDLQSPLFTHLKRRTGHADPRAFLMANRHWRMGDLLKYLISHSGAWRVIFSDANAGLRVTMLDRWLDALPQALFVHAITDVSVFTDLARDYYESRLFIPPDYQDHCAVHPSPRFAPELAWYQLHSTLSRGLGERTLDRQIRRIALDRDPIDALAALRIAPQYQAPQTPLPSIAALAHWLGYDNDL